MLFVNDVVAISIIHHLIPHEDISKAEMDKKQCGTCGLDVNDLEPVRCGFCEAYFHISQQCCGINLRACKDIFAQGKVLFICPPCRNILDGRRIRAYVADVSPSESMVTNSLTTQLQQLSGMVEVLSKKVDNISSAPSQNTGPIFSPMIAVPNQNKTPIWSRMSTKRRRGDFGQSIRPSANKGTKAMDFSDLSIPSIIPAAPTPTFWLYLSGFHPMINEKDVEKIVSRCLNVNDGMKVIRLVPKGMDVSNMSFVSFKIGLDPASKPQALNAENWPDGLLFREFMDQPKNMSQRNNSTRENLPSTSLDSPATTI